MTLLNTSGTGAQRVGIVTTLLSIGILAGSGCQTLPGLSGEEGGRLTIKDTPSQRHQPRSLESLIRPSSDELSTRPPDLTASRPARPQGININDVELEPPKTHVEADLSIEEIAASDEQQLPEIMDSADEAFGKLQTPAASASRSSTGTQGEPQMTEPVVADRQGFAAPVTIAPVSESLLPDRNVRAMPTPPAQTNSPPASPPANAIGMASMARRPAAAGALPNAAPLMTLKAQSSPVAENKLSDEIDTLLGPVSPSGELPAADGPSWSIGDEVTASPSLAAGIDPERPDGQPESPATGGVTGVQPANWSAADSGTATQIAAIDEAETLPQQGPQGGSRRSDPVANDSADGQVNQLQQLTWQEHLKTTVDLLGHQIQAQDVAENQSLDIIRMKLMQIVAGSTSVPSIDDAGLAEPQKSFWQNELASIQVMLNGLDDEESLGNEAAQRRRATTAARHLELAASQLASQASLQVENAAFCNQVRGFGQYTAAGNTFLQSQQILIYCEIANYDLRSLPADSTGQDSQLAELRGQYVIVDDNDRVVNQHQYQAVQDKSRWRRKDFYMYFPVTIPQLAPGHYRLQLSIEDMVGRKFASVHPDLEFTIPMAGQRGVPSRPNEKTAAGSASDKAVR